MFKKKEIYNTEPSAKKLIETVIGDGAVFEGTITTQAALRIDGTVVGDVKCSGTMIVGAPGEVRGTVNASELLIAGTIHGNVTTSGKTEFVSGGYLNGDLVTGDLSVEQGAYFDGNCRTINNPKAPAPVQPQLPLQSSVTELPPVVPELPPMDELPVFEDVPAREAEESPFFPTAPVDF